MTRKDMQWMRVAQYRAVYMGVVETVERPEFISDDDNIQDMEGYSPSVYMSGYWRVYANFIEYKRAYPNARFDDDGFIWVWAD